MDFAALLENIGKQPGLYADISNESYHSGPGLSKTGLDMIDQCPAIYYGCKLDPKRPPPKDRAGQLEGNLLHTLALEPQEFDSRYVVGPTVNRNTKAWREFVADHPGLDAIQDPQLEAAQIMADNIRAIPDIRDSLERGFAERSAYWRDPETDVLCKCRPDFCHPTAQGNILIDLKTYNSADPRECARQIARKRYHVQDAFYSDGHKIASGEPTLAFVFVFVSTEWPHLATPMMLTPEDRQAGRDAYRRNVDTFAQCMNTGRWPGYTDSVTTISLPSYIHYERED